MTDSSCTTPSAEDSQGFYQPGGSSIQGGLGHQIRRITTLMRQHVDRDMEAHGLTSAQWLPLFMLAAGQARTVAELARMCQLDAGAMTRLLDRLEHKGLCHRVRSTQDRRVVELELTPQGRQAAEPVPRTLCDLQNAMLDGFSQEEWQTLMQFLQRIHDNLLRRQMGAADDTRSPS